MYARVTTFEFQAEKLEEGFQIARESIAPVLRQQEGLKSLLALQDRTTGKSVLISLFETEADMRAGVTSGLVQQQAAKLMSLLLTVPLIEFYEVADME